ncbi:MAG: cytochrome c oxidase subunit 3 [Alphaproteobacteria bacterium]
MAHNNIKESNAKVGHNFHLVNPSPWPIATSFSLLILAIGGILFMHKYMIGHFVLPLGLLLVISTVYCWWKDVVTEGIRDKAHSEIVQQGLRIGMALFILSEIMFFYAFFFSYFKASFDPVNILEPGEVWAIKEGIWPPAGIEKFDPWDIPFMNTLILLLSGTTVTWAHHALIENNKKDLIQALTYTVILGVFFSCMQAIEYMHSPFLFKDGVYASNFYMATGFHGAHVLIGTIFLLVCLIRAKKGDFDKGKGHLALEFAAWYWHFVDVVWLFLYIFVYIF